MTESAAIQLAERLKQRGATVSTAESCTGGLIASLLTDLAGSSAYLLGGVVAYSNIVKEKQLGVSPRTLETVGAVSEETAREMALGARALFNTDYAISVTGIAGPGGGTSQKPVGLTFIGVASADGAVVERHLWEGNRLENKAASAQAALRLLIKVLDGIAKIEG